jgi:3-deoxy-D-manno-octulosonic-acid transferase
LLTAYDIAYLGLSPAALPLAISRAVRDKLLDALRTRRGNMARRAAGPGVLIHAVSVGELNAARGLIDQLRERVPDVQIVITTTTQAGLARAGELYGEKAGFGVVRFPLDFSWRVDRLLDAARPDVVVLMELELWPNWMKRCAQRDIPVVLANGRITEPSYRRYQWLGPVTRRMFGRLAFAFAQDQTFADRFAGLGVHRDRLCVGGSMKFDAASIGSDVPGTDNLARDLGLDRSRDRILVCGSTGPGEEAICLDLYRSLKRQHPALRLVIVPRKPERFDEVASLIESSGFTCGRRSRRTLGEVILIDTIGELRKAYAFAEVVFVGRSLVDLGPRQHGSDMIEPAALGKPVAVGPFTGNFDQAVRAFRAADAIRVVHDAASLTSLLNSWLDQPNDAASLGNRARDVVGASQGATARLADWVVNRLPLAVESGRR